MVEGDARAGAVRPGRHAAADEHDRTIAMQFEVPVLVTSDDRDRRRNCARTIHARSCRSRGPFVEFDCAPTHDDAAIVELRFRDAAGGTLFLDRIEAMTPPLQGCVLQLMREPAAPTRGDAADAPGVRVIAGASQPLLAAVAAGTFAESLFYTLNVVHLVL